VKGTPTPGVSATPRAIACGVPRSLIGRSGRRGALNGISASCCGATAGPALLADAGSPFAALRQWVDLFVDFLVTKHGLADALQSDSSGFDALHTYFLDRLVPVCKQLLDAAVNAGEIRPGTHAYELMRGIGNLCIGRDSDPRYDPRRLVELLLQGLQRPQSS
jgi:hypothetical protein